MKMVLYTIGYEGLNQAEFLSCLKKYNVSVVADVRNLPLSRKKGFSKTPLSEFLHNEHIEYMNFPDLGADKTLRNQLKESGNYEIFFQEIEQSLLRHIDTLQKINQMICHGKNVALLCFEKNYKLCHRSIVAKVLKRINRNNLKISHLE